MLNVGSCTVLYNPDKYVMNNISSYIGLMQYCVVIDNSDEKNEYSKQLMSNPNINYIDMHGNKGIASALNKGAEFLYAKGVEFMLTMDQDSTFPTNYYNNIEQFIENLKKDYSVIGLNFNHDIDINCTKIIETLYWLTSGNFVNLSDFYRIGKFDENLFIDYVDIELGYRLFTNNLKLCYLEGYSLNHKIGNPIEINLFGKKYYAMNHSPIRYYYRYRNAHYLYHINKKFFKREYYKELFVNIPKMIFFEKDKIFKIKMICRGIMDSKKGKLGQYR